MNQPNLIIAINACNKLIDIFLGPFLVAYFLATSIDSIVDLSIYKILSFFFLAAFGLIIGYAVKKNHALTVFRVGVITRFVYILTILLMQDAVVDHLGIIALLYGFSTIAFWTPFNIYTVKCVSNHKRASFEVRKKAISTLIGVLGPLSLGALITTTNYVFAAGMMLIISAIQIFCSFYLRTMPIYERTYSLISSFRRFMKMPQIKRMMLADFINGLTLSDGVLTVLVTIVVINSFQTDLNLGLINSVTAIIAVAVCYMYSKCPKGKYDKLVITISSIMPVLSVLLLTLHTTDVTVVSYAVMLETFGLGLLSLILIVRVYNASNKLISKEDITEFYTIREVALCLGRMTGYAIMLAIGLVGPECFYPAMIALSALIIVQGVVINKINACE